MKKFNRLEWMLLILILLNLIGIAEKLIQAFGG